MVAKNDDNIYVLNTIKICIYFSLFFSTALKRVELLKILKLMQLLWKSLPRCKNGREDEIKSYGQSLLHPFVFQKENIKFSEATLVAVHCNFLISCIMILWGCRPWIPILQRIFNCLSKMANKTLKQNAKFVQTY